jgi:hypothetical protein
MTLGIGIGFFKWIAGNILMAFKNVANEVIEKNIISIDGYAFSQPNLSLYAYTGGVSDAEVRKIENNNNVSVVMLKRIDPLLSRILLFWMPAKIVLFKIEKSNNIFEVFENILCNGLSSIFVVEKECEGRFLNECYERDSFFESNFPSIKTSQRGIIMRFEYGMNLESDCSGQDLFLGPQVSNICKIIDQ